MLLNKRLFRVPLWRSHSFPFSALNLIVVCYKNKIQHLNAIINSQNKSLVRGIVVFDDKNLELVKVAIDGQGEHSYPVIPVSELCNYAHCEIILFSKEYDYRELLFGQRLLVQHGIESFYVVMPYKHDHGIRSSCIPTYYSANKRSLNHAYSMIVEEQSRDVFAARVRSLLTGDIGYLPLSRYPQYMHPVVKPNDGDIVIDGGVSEEIWEQLEIAKAVGRSGRIYGFEPDEEGFANALASLSQNEDCSNYTLVPLGLWDKKETVSFLPGGAGARVAQQQDGKTVTVKMTSVDEFVKENGLQKVDYIKLDVEGAELQVLQGAVETIRKHKPKLAIAAYHKFEDLFLIPTILNKINPDYTLYFGHHHPTLLETIMYAAIGKK